MLTGNLQDTEIKIACLSGFTHKSNSVFYLNRTNVQDLLNFAKPKETLLAVDASDFMILISNSENARELIKQVNRCVSVDVSRCETSQKGNIVRSFKN
jgi:hypothetical protein